MIFAAWSLFGSGPHAEQHFTFAAAGAVRMRIETANGKIAVTTGQPGSPVAVTAIKRADTIEQVNALSVDARRSGSEIVLRALYPKGCGSGSCGGEISFTVTAPPGIALDLNSSNGSIDASGISGNAVLSTSNGSVSASYAAFGNVRSVALSTQNGSVSLMLPASAKLGKVKMDTAVGRINSDWPLNVDRASFVGGSVNQTLTGGAAAITLTTTNGSITLKKISP
jgi:DUF4097 and DUF4098 domain-containing protein YvlB